MAVLTSWVKHLRTSWRVRYKDNVSDVLDNIRCLSEYQPDKPDKTSTDPKSWLALECGATEKFSATGSYKQDIPSAVYSSENFGFMRNELESGYFAIQMVPDNRDGYGKRKLTKVCSLRNDFNTNVNNTCICDTFLRNKFQFLNLYLDLL